MATSVDPNLLDLTRTVYVYDVGVDVRGWGIISVRLDSTTRTKILLGVVGVVVKDLLSPNFRGF